MWLRNYGLKLLLLLVPCIGICQSTRKPAGSKKNVQRSPSASPETLKQSDAKPTLDQTMGFIVSTLNSQVTKNSVSCSGGNYKFWTDTHIYEGASSEGCKLNVIDDETENIRSRINDSDPFETRTNHYQRRFTFDFGYITFASDEPDESGFTMCDEESQNRQPTRSSKLSLKLTSPIKLIFTKNDEASKTVVRNIINFEFTNVSTAGSFRKALNRASELCSTSRLF